MDEIRYGIIGTGMMGIEHIENLGALVTDRRPPVPMRLDDTPKERNLRLDLVRDAGTVVDEPGSQLSGLG